MKMEVGSFSKRKRQEEDDGFDVYIGLVDYIFCSKLNLYFIVDFYYV